MLQLASQPDSDLEAFASPFLVVMSKGHKLHFQSTEDPLIALRKYSDVLDTIFNWEYLPLSEVFSDIVVEWCPKSRPGEPDCYRVHTEPQVYLLKRYCLVEHLRWLTDEEDSSAGKTTFYPVHFLRDACNLTFTPNKTSVLWRAGVRFFQAYAVEKEIFDTQNVYPFDNPYLFELALDPMIWESAASSEK
jgi:hypothetical protein